MENNFDISNICKERFKPTNSKTSQGTFGIVKLGRDRKSKNRFVAIKKFKTCREDNGEMSAEMLREIAFFKFTTPNSNLLRLLDLIKENNNFYIVLEGMQRNLKEHYQTQKLTKGSKKNIFVQIVKGLEHLHNNSIMHRDIKPENILANNRNQIKIGDFGLCKFFHQTLYFRCHTQLVQTIWYRAPEVLLGYNMYNEKIDMWSIGCLWFEIYTETVLFRNTDLTEINQIFMIFQYFGTPDEKDWNYITKLPNYNKDLPKFPKLKSTEISKKRNSLLNLFNYNPEKRPSCTKLREYLENKDSLLEISL